MQARFALPVVLFGCMLLPRPTLCQADGPIFRNHTLIGGNFFFAFSPHTTDWVSLEHSADLRRWRLLASVATTNASTLIHDPDGQSAPRRFYRLRQPGVTVGEARSLWQGAAVQDYQFRIEHMRMHEFATLSATVRVTVGQKTIASAEVNGVPVEEPDDSDFPSVEELFSLLEQAQTSGCRRVAVMYDAMDGHPTWCVVERVAINPIGKEVDEFRITDLTYVANEDGS